MVVAAGTKTGPDKPLVLVLVLVLQGLVVDGWLTYSAAVLLFDGYREAAGCNGSDGSFSTAGCIEHCSLTDV